MRAFRRRDGWLVAMLAVAIGPLGCGSGDELPREAVSGKVEFDGLLTFSSFKLIMLDVAVRDLDQVACFVPFLRPRRSAARPSPAAIVRI